MQIKNPFNYDVNSLLSHGIMAIFWIYWNTRLPTNTPQPIFEGCDMDGAIGFPTFISSGPRQSWAPALAHIPFPFLITIDRLWTLKLKIQKLGLKYLYGSFETLDELDDPQTVLDKENFKRVSKSFSEFSASFSFQRASFQWALFG